MRKFTTTLLGIGLMLPTLGVAQSVVIGTDFEDPAFPPSGWQTLDRDGDGNGWMRYQDTDIYVSQYNYSKGCAISFARERTTYSPLGSQDNWLITEPFTVPNAQTALSLIYSAQDLDNVEPIEILISETDDDPASFTRFYYTTADNGYDDDINFSTMERNLSEYAGKTIRLAVRHQAYGTYALAVDNMFVYNMMGPKMPSGLTVTPSNTGSLSATLSWNTPDKTANGVALENVDILIYRDGELLATVSGTPGAVDSWTDTTPSLGTHSYALAAANDQGQTRLTSAKSAFIGPDVPKEVGNPLAIAYGDHIVITWDAPTKGQTNGYIDPAGIRYDVYRVVDEVTEKIASNLEETSYTDNDPIPNKSMIYAIQAFNEAGTSKIMDYTAAIVTDGDEFATGLTPYRDNGLARLPIDINSQYSVSQTIYYPSEFQFAKGNIHSIIYKGYKGNDSELNYPVKIYMHETAAENLQNGWDTTGLSESALVYEGDITYLQGARDYLLNLTTPYNYQGGNLVVTFVKTDKPNGSYADRFYSTSVETPYRSYTGSTYDPIDINALPSFSTWSEKKLNEIPSTRFLMTPAGVASVAGKVTNSVTSQGVEGAAIEIPAYGISVLSDSEGNYRMPYVPLDVTEANVSRAGYEPSTITLSLSEGGQADGSIALVQMPFKSVSGKIIAQDTGLTADGASVTAAGYDNFTVLADENGNFTITPLYVGQEYTLKAAYPLYQPFTYQLTVADDLDLGQIELERALIPPFAVETEVAADGSAISLTWEDPLARNVKAGWNSMNKDGDDIVIGPAGDKWYSPEDYNAGHAYTAATVAQRKLAGTVVSQAKIYIKATQGTFTAKVWEGTRDNAVEIAAQTIPAEEVSADGSWITVTFDNPAEIRSGKDYIVGVHCLNASEAPLGEVRDYISNENNIIWADNGQIYWNSYNGYAMEANFCVPGTEEPIVDNPDAPECEYNVYRRASDLADWTLVTPAPVKNHSYTDGGWATLLSGDWTYGVTAVYQNGESVPARALAVSRSNDIDAGISRIISPTKSVEMQTEAEVKVTVTNYGELPVSNIPVEVLLNGESVGNALCAGPLNKGESFDLTVGTIELTEGVHTLSVKTSLEGDNVPANDTFEMILPNMANIQLTGYRWNAYGNAGFMNIPSNNAEGASYLREITPQDALITSGEYYDGVVYAYAAKYYGAPTCFVSIKPDVWTIETNLENTDDYCLDMAYDYENKRMLGLRAEGENVSLVSIDLDYGTMEYICPVQSGVHALACSKEGEVYVMDGDGYFCSLNPQTGIVTRIGHTGVEDDVKYLQSMAFDHNTGRLFWAHEGSIASGALREINPATGESTFLGNVLYNGSEPSEVVALHTPYTHQVDNVESVGMAGLNLTRNEDGSYRLEAVNPTVISIYTAGGLEVSRMEFNAGVSEFRLPADQVLYLIKADDGKTRLTLKALPK